MQCFKRLFARRAARRMRHPAISDLEWQRAAQRLPCLATLTADERARLRQLAGEFLQCKEFAGVQGLVLRAPMLVSISLQACLPILELGLQAYEGWLGVVVYPGEFVVPRHELDEDGVLHEFAEPALGLAMDGGPVVLAWHDEPAAYGELNVVIHEFAHKLDMLSGAADGLPPLHAGMSVEEWDSALGEAYEDFCSRLDEGEDTAIDPYAGEHPAEFFAVMSEVFFTDPGLLNTEYPAVYAQLRLFYRQDPLARVQAQRTQQA